VPDDDFSICADCSVLASPRVVDCVCSWSDQPRHELHKLVAGALHETVDLIDPFVEATRENFSRLYVMLCLHETEWYPHHDLVRSHFKLTRRRRYAFPDHGMLGRGEHWVGAVIRIRYMGIVVGHEAGRPFVLYMHVKMRVREREGSRRCL
jgi:hypothetical protein